MKKAILAAGLLTIAGFTTYAMAAPKPTAGHYNGEKLAKSAKVTIGEAKALAARPGEVTDRELEKEKGGSGLHLVFKNA